jgi:hypothetical protein
MSSGPAAGFCFAVLAGTPRIVYEDRSLEFVRPMNEPFDLEDFIGDARRLVQLLIGDREPTEAETRTAAEALRAQCWDELQEEDTNARITQHPTQKLIGFRLRA